MTLQRRLQQAHRRMEELGASGQKARMFHLLLESRVIRNKVEEVLLARFFVVHLSDRDLAERGRTSREQPFEIQLLDAKDRAKALGYVGADEQLLDIDGYSVAFAVIEVARRQATGQGDYVDENGNSIQLF